MGVTETNPHVDPGTGAAHGHSDEETPPGSLPHHVNDDYQLPFFTMVDVFSVISIGQDAGLILGDLASEQAAALDYVVDFANSVTGAFSGGVMSVVWIPGWTHATYIDNYVARWVPSIPGMYDLVAIEPLTPDAYEATEIDAVKAIYQVPEPAVWMLMLAGVAGGLVRKVRRT